MAQDLNLDLFSKAGLGPGKTTGSQLLCWFPPFCWQGFDDY
jgi:hypothetical protein